MVVEGLFALASIWVYKKVPVVHQLADNVLDKVDSLLGNKPKEKQEPFEEPKQC